MKQNEINEELVEQAKIIADKYAIATLKFEDRVDEEMMVNFRAEAHIDSQGIIALAEFFLSAVRRGDLDKALGVVDRWYPGGKMPLDEWINEVICVARPDVFIAFRKGVRRNSCANGAPQP